MAGVYSDREDIVKWLGSYKIFDKSHHEDLIRRLNGRTGTHVPIMRNIITNEFFVDKHRTSNRLNSIGRLRSFTSEEKNTKYEECCVKCTYCSTIQSDIHVDIIFVLDACHTVGRELKSVEYV